MNLPEPLPFKVVFDHDGRTYTAELYPASRDMEESVADDPTENSEAGYTRIVEFEPGGKIVRVTLHGVEQDDPVRFEDSIIHHLNTTPGIQDGEYPKGYEMGIDEYYDTLMNEFASQLHSAGMAGWMILGTESPSAFVAMECAAPSRAIFLTSHPRTKRESGRLSARINLYEARFRKIVSFIHNQADLVAELCLKYGLPVRCKSGTWYEVGGIDFKTGKLKPLHPNGEGSHTLIELYLESGLSAMDKEGAQRCANCLLRLLMQLEELDRCANQT